MKTKEDIEAKITYLEKEMHMIREDIKNGEYDDVIDVTDPYEIMNDIDLEVKMLKWVLKD